MNILAIVKYAAVLVILTLLAPPLGEYLAHVFTGQRPALDPVLRPDARATSMVNNGRTMAGMWTSSPFYTWTTAVAMLVGRLGLIAANALLVGGLTLLPGLALGPTGEQLVMAASR